MTTGKLGQVGSVVTGGGRASSAEESRMRGFHKSLKASQEKMGAALNAAAASASDSINSQLPPVQAARGVRRQRLVARVQVRRPRSHVSRPGPGAGTCPPEARRRRRRRAPRRTSSSASSTRTGSATVLPSSPSAWCRSLVISRASERTPRPRRRAMEARRSDRGSRGARRATCDARQDPGTF